MLQGIYLIHRRILVLTADPMSKFSGGADIFCPVSAYNLINYASTLAAHQKRLINHLLALPIDITHAIYVYVLSHFLSTHGHVRRALLHCVCFGSLQSIILDKAHLLAKQATSFWPKLRMIGTAFLQPLYQSTSPKKHTFPILPAHLNNHSCLERLTRTSFLLKYCC